MRNPLLWITVANVLYLASYSVRDILWLRILTVVGALLLIPYYALQPLPLLAAIGWSFLFIAINGVWIAVLIAERRPIHLDPEETRLRDLSFPSLSAREARNLFVTGVWEEIEPGGSIVEHDKRTRRFSVILRGNADVIYHGTKIAELGAGQFVGTIDQRAESAPIDVIVRERVRLKCWAGGQLTAFLATRPDVALALERSVGLEVQRLLDTTLSQLDTPKA
jgi:hypothetical protein